jgi:hypothetical protein
VIPPYGISGIGGRCPEEEAEEPFSAGEVNGGNDLENGVGEEEEASPPGGNEMTRKGVGLIKKSQDCERWEGTEEMGWQLCIRSGKFSIAPLTSIDAREDHDVLKAGLSNKLDQLLDELHFSSLLQM